ncbi:gamma-glutamyl-gamma-aminobutyrate hydrolase family protein [Salinisphaera sp. PC39]|uniref:gamma-glutamyl-gamma-aminobutyrate hydrolase family protein n=1 Tax=Salinisphaera sp. PC39 TaxID=1304156 RepID=UPI00333EE962
MSRDRPLVGITGPAGVWSPGWWCAAHAIRRAGGRPVRLTATRPTPPAPLDAVIIGGGDDISPALYQAPQNPARRLDPARDAFELRVLDAALARGLPILGICRGAQLLNVVHGGTLHADIRTRRRHPPYRATLRARRPVAIRRGSRLAAILGTRRIRVNSLHRQAVRGLGRGLRAVARDRDNIVQAIEATDGGPVMGVQWHPEYLLLRHEQTRLFAALVTACAAA